MPALIESPQIGPCPDAERLSAFNRGLLPLPDLEVIAQHVSSCPECEARVNAQEAGDGDTLLSRLRRCLGRPTPADELGAAALEAKAMGFNFSLRETPALGDKHGDDRTPRPEPPLPSHIGNYEILGRLGVGGMGIVFKARQLPINRLVALKCIGGGAWTDTQSLSRFRIEGAAIARLSHPNVVRIYDFDEHEGLPFFSMELVEGGSLAARLHRGTMTPSEAARILSAVARAVHYAHQNQVLHRDLKPGNILLSADGTPKISDFGLAKLLDQETENTRGPMVLGTPSYMAPEQAAARNAVVDARADVYGLGAILYEALSGQPPFKSDSRAKTLDLVCTVEPEPPSRSRKEVPAELEAICLKCLEKVPAKRYQTAEALANDLDRWLRGEPTLARPARWPRKTWRFVRRHKIAAALVLVLIGGATLAIYLDPDRPRRDLSAKLVALAVNQPLTLIGEKGEPAWYRVRHGGEATKIATAADGAFSVHSWSLCLLELLPDPMWESYRIAAKIRQENSDLAGEVGVYFAHTTCPGPEGDCHLVARFVYQDMRTRSERLAQFPIQVKIRNEANPLLGFHILAHAVDIPETVVSGPPYLPAGAHTPTWRDLEIVVKRKELVARFAGKYVGPIAIEAFETALVKSGFDPKGAARLEPAPTAMSRQFAFRGGLGLYVRRGSASFQNVSITALPGID